MIKKKRLVLLISIAAIIIGVGATGTVRKLRQDTLQICENSKKEIGIYRMVWQSVDSNRQTSNDSNIGDLQGFRLTPSGLRFAARPHATLKEQTANIFLAKGIKILDMKIIENPGKEVFVPERLMLGDRFNPTPNMILSRQTWEIKSEIIATNTPAPLTLEAINSQLVEANPALRVSKITPDTVTRQLNITLEIAQFTPWKSPQRYVPATGDVASWRASLNKLDSWKIPDLVSGGSCLRENINSLGRLIKATDMFKIYEEKNDAQKWYRVTMQAIDDFNKNKEVQADKSALSQQNGPSNFGRRN